MSNINRHSAGTKQAGEAVGGRFAASQQTEASGAGLALSPAPDSAELLHNDAPITEDSIQALLEAHDLDYGNAEVEDGDFMTVEAPNHATWRVDTDGFEDGGTMGDLKATIAQDLDDFDPDEQFDEIWSPEFGEHNGFTPRQFLDGLREDKAFFEHAAMRLRAEANGDNPHQAKALVAGFAARKMESEIELMREEQRALHRENLRERVLAEHPTAETLDLEVHRNANATGDSDRYLFTPVAVRNADGETLSGDMSCEGDLGTGAVLYESQAHGSFVFDGASSDRALFENENYFGPMRASVNIHRGIDR
ncbi:hypothetical protein ACXR2T_07695 [Leucobacter sp. HY1910]